MFLDMNVLQYQFWFVSRKAEKSGPSTSGFEAGKVLSSVQEMEPTSVRPARIPLAGTGALQGDAAPPIVAPPVPQQHPGAQEHNEGSHRRTEADQRSWPPDSGKSDVGEVGDGKDRTGATPDVALPAAEGPGASGSDGGGKRYPAAELGTFGWAEQAAVVRAGQKDEMYAHELLVYITGAERKRSEFVLAFACIAAWQHRARAFTQSGTGSTGRSRIQHASTRAHLHANTHTHARIRTLRTRTAALEATVGSGFINRHKPTLAAAAHLIYLTLTTVSGTPTLGEVSEKTDGVREKKMEGAESGGGGERELELATLLFPSRNNQVAGTLLRHLQRREEGRVARWPCGYSRSKHPNTKP